MVMFNSKLLVYQRVNPIKLPVNLRIQVLIAVICSWDLCINYNPIDGHIFQKNNNDIFYRKIMWIEGDLKPLRSAIRVRSFMVVHLWLVAPSHLRSCDADFMAIW